MIPRKLQPLYQLLVSCLGRDNGTRVFNYLALKAGSDIATLRLVYEGIHNDLRAVPAVRIAGVFSKFFSSNVWDSLRSDFDNSTYTASILKTYLRLELVRAVAVSTDAQPIVSDWSDVTLEPLELHRRLDSVISRHSAFVDFAENGDSSTFFLSLCGYCLSDATQKRFIAPTCEAFFCESQEDMSSVVYLSLLAKLFLFFVESRGVDPSRAVHTFTVLAKERTLDPRDLILILCDFYEDDRYREQVLTILLSLAATAIRSFYRDRRALITTVLKLQKDLIRISGGKALQYARRVLELHVSHPDLDIAGWVQEGARIIRRHGEESLAAKTYFDRESDLSKRVWRLADRGLQFDEISKRLHTFIRGITERNVDLQPSERETLEGRPHAYYTDGKVVFIPPRIDHAGEKDDNYTVLLHSTAHECGHIEFGSFSEDRKRYLFAARELNTRFPGQYARNRNKIRDHISRLRRKFEYLGYEVVGISENRLPYLTRLLFHVELPYVLKDLWNITEDRRIDYRVAQRYRGFAREKAFVDERDFEVVPNVSKLGGADNLVTALAQQLGFGKVKGEVPATNQPYLARMLARIDASKPPETADAFDTMLTAAELYVVFIEYLQKEQPTLLERLKKMEEHRFTCFNLCNNPRNASVQVDVAWCRREKRLRDEARGGNDRTERDENRKNASDVISRHHGYAEPRIDHDSFEREYTYPEWDHKRNMYMVDHCKLYECKLPAPARPRESGFSLGVGTVSAVRRAFSTLKPRELDLVHGMDDGQEIDFDRYFDALMDLKSGNQMNENFFIRRDRRLRNVASALVLDMSPSTSQEIQGDSIFAHEQEASYLAAEAMNAIGDRFGMYCFFDYGPDATLFYTLKGLDERYDRTTVDRLTEFIPASRGWSRIAVGLRHLIEQFRNLDAKSRIIFLITDGLPFYFEGTEDEGKYSTKYVVDGRVVEEATPVPVVRLDHRETEYAVGDLRKVYEEASFAGIRLFCITLEEECLPTMRKIFDKSLIFLPDVNQLPERLVQVFRAVAV